MCIRDTRMKSHEKLKGILLVRVCDIYHSLITYAYFLKITHHTDNTRHSHTHSV